MRIRCLQERGLGFSNVWYNIDCDIVVPLVGGKGNVQEDRHLAAGTGVVARPGLVARAGDRPLFTGAASLVRIFLLPLLWLLSRPNRVNFVERSFFQATH